MKKSKRPIIFLDMDGVMNNDQSLKKSRQGIFPIGNAPAMTVSTLCVHLLQKLVKQTNSQIVISSSWRSHTTDDMDFNLSICKKKYFSGNKTVINALVYAGFIDCREFIIGNTPDSLYRLKRGAEIQLWLDSHPDAYTTNVTPFVIIDDDEDMTEDQLKNHFVKTNPKKGFTITDFDKAFAILTKTS